jgi:O-acetyl-ADP-ribose deacetylase (regulator of RNase III)
MVLAQVAERVLSQCAEPGDPSPAVLVPPARQRFPLAAGAGRAFVTVHVQPIELITGVDILVSSENVHMEMARTFGSSVSGAIRRTGSIRGAAGEVVSDVVNDELRAWMTANGRSGLPVAPGTVAATSPGALAHNGVRRVYHAAVVIPRAGSDDYDVHHATLVYAVRQVFRLAEQERGDFDPPLSALCFPLLGTGRGGLPLETGARWLWQGLRESLERHPHWSVHVAIPRPETAEMVARVISGEMPP